MGCGTSKAVIEENEILRSRLEQQSTTLAQTQTELESTRQQLSQALDSHQQSVQQYKMQLQVSAVVPTDCMHGP